MRDQGTMLFITYQIMNNLQLAHRSAGGEEYPEPFASIINAIDMILLDVHAILHADCIEHSDFEDKLMLTTLVPLGISAVVLCAQAVRAAVWKVDMNKGYALQGVLMLLFYLLPATSTVIFSAFPCATFHDGEKEVEFMRADHSIECSGHKHERIYTLAVSMAFVFPLGVPLLMLALLAQRREAIVSRTTRRGDPRELDTISFLFRNFAPRYWWAPVFDMFRRIVLGSVLLVFSPGEGSLIGFSMSFFSLILMREVQPFYDDSSEVIAWFSNWNIVFCTVALMISDVNARQAREYDTPIDLVSATLLVINFALLAMVSSIQYHASDNSGRSSGKGVVGKAFFRAKSGGRVAPLRAGMLPQSFRGRAASLEAENTDAASAAGGGGGRANPTMARPKPEVKPTPKPEPECESKPLFDELAASAPQSKLKPTTNELALRPLGSVPQPLEAPYMVPPNRPVPTSASSLPLGGRLGGAVAPLGTQPHFEPRPQLDANAEAKAKTTGPGPGQSIETRPKPMARPPAVAAAPDAHGRLSPHGTVSVVVDLSEAIGWLLPMGTLTITRVFDGRQAQRLGVQGGARIVGVNGTPVVSYDHYRAIMDGERNANAKWAQVELVYE
mmetsp:Transcript_12284/g.33223  ORF Transcript_12284/g.33223 Transcript_12284/m.33223 type:complete len:614 (-) Transcript_12284:841-2682(-)